MNKTLLYFKTWMKATGRNLVSAKVLSLVVLLSAVPYAAFSGNGSLSEVFGVYAGWNSDCFRVPFRIRMALP